MGQPQGTEDKQEVFSALGLKAGEKGGHLTGAVASG